MKQNYNNESLARLGHGKWKSALGCTLLMIGLLMGGMNAWGQDAIPDALKLDKYFIPDDATGHSGKLWLETYTTGSVEHITASQPTDIVLVLDASSSMINRTMTYNNGTPEDESDDFQIKRMTALQIAVRAFIDQIYQDSQHNGFGGEGNENYDHRIAVISFNNNTSAHLLSTESATDNINATTCSDALVPVRQYYDSRLGLGLTGTGFENLSSNHNAMDNGVIYNSKGSGTFMHRGLDAAEDVLTFRTTNGRGVTFTAPGTTVELPRNMVVVFFTDGYPGQNGDSGDWPVATGTNDIVPNANNAVAAASTLKQVTVVTGGQTVHPTIYSIAVTTGADPTTNYTVTQETQGSGYWARTYYVTGAKCFNALLHFISSEYGSEINNWVTPAQNPTYGASSSGTDYAERQKYFAAENVDELTSIFQQISSASGGTTVDMGANTVVQDVISASFKLPEGANINDIMVYAPKLQRLHRADATSPWQYDFTAQTITIGDEQVKVDTITGGENYSGRLVLDTDPDSETYGQITDDTYENRITSSDVIYYDPEGDAKTIQFKNFDFSHYYCGPITDNGDTTGYVGRKLVMVIPIEIEEGVWGDGISTNEDISWVTPDGEYHYQFPVPSTNVLADVWTEVVQYQPATFDVANDPIEIGTPEDLAWFISYVNGRAGYENNDQISSHPSANAILTADIDMSAHNWVPIGTGKENANGTFGDDKLAYVGTFDGNGHVITGLKNNASKYYKRAEGQEEGGIVVFPGMFSNVGNGGVVKNVFVLDADFRGRHHDEYFVHHGIIADTLSAGGLIFNCEAVGNITCNNDQPAEDMKLVYGGLVGLNQGTIHSSMAMATLTGYCMGGAVGENRGTLANSFTNGVYNYLGTSDGVVWEAEDPGGLFRYVGGLAGRNHGGEFVNGTINNCYVRFQRDNSYGDPLSSNAIQFGQLVGSNCVTNSTTKGTITNCYWPHNLSMRARVADDTETDYGNSNYYSTPTAPSLIRYQRSNDNMVGGTLDQEEYTISGVPTTVDVWKNGTTLVDVLNGNIPETNSTWAHWKRTTAGDYVSSQNGGNINGDYPVLKIDGFTCLASTDGIALDYAASLDEMLERHNTGVMNASTALPGYVDEEETQYNGSKGHEYSVSQAPTLYGATINLYDNDGPVAKSTQSGEEVARTVVYIDEDVSLLQDASSSIDAYTGQTLINFNGSGNIQAGNRWHNVSSSLQQSGFGWDYHITGEVPHAWGDDWADYKAEWDAANPLDVLTPENPCKIWLAQADEDHELFPSDMASPNPMDFYCFFEPEYHWVNFKRNGASHWHMDKYDEPIDYYYNNGTEDVHDNEDHFIPGKGYLLAIHAQYFNDMHFWTESEHAKKDRQFLQNRGTLNNGNVDIPVTYTTDAIIDLDGYKTGLEGYNLLGNPYQSYLDFDEFVRINTTGDNSLWNDGDTYAQTYAIYDPSTDKYVQYKSGASVNGYTGSKFINMHQGFFIQTSKSTQAHFTNEMRSNSGTPNFRGEQPAYPLINFIVTDNEGNSDVAVLEVNRPENDGAKKLRMGSPAGRIYFRYDNTNMAIFFRDNAEGHQTLNFAAEEDGNFTLNWNTANADFRSLTLVDNITGIKTDMLTHDHYTFEGRVDDYNTRFKIVFGEMDTNEEEPVLEHFAFFDHGNLIVNGTGHFEVVDVLGRVVYATELTDTQNTVSLPSNVRGVCMLCFTRNNETKVQKMVIQ